MARPLVVTLTPPQQTELRWLRDHAPQPYLREQAAAILKVAAGASVRQVALTGCLKARAPETVSAWIRRYLTGGLAGLRVASGRGRKPAFSPSARQPPGRRRRGRGTVPAVAPAGGSAP